LIWAELCVILVDTAKVIFTDMMIDIVIAILIDIVTVNWLFFDSYFERYCDSFSWKKVWRIFYSYCATSFYRENRQLWKIISYMLDDVKEVIFYMSIVIFYLSIVIFYMLNVLFYVSNVIFSKSIVIFYMSIVIFYMLKVIFCMSNDIFSH